jgi:hypothetical protein
VSSDDELDYLRGLERFVPGLPDPRLPGAEESPTVEIPMVQSPEMSKYRSTEFLAFLLTFSVSTISLFIGKTSFEWWLIGSLGSAVVCGVVRTTKHLRILGLEFEGYRSEREGAEG